MYKGTHKNKRFMFSLKNKPQLPFIFRSTRQRYVWPFTWHHKSKIILKGLCSSSASDTSDPDTVCPRAAELAATLLPPRDAYATLQVLSRSHSAQPSQQQPRCVFLVSCFSNISETRRRDTMFATFNICRCVCSCLNHSVVQHVGREWVPLKAAQ